MLSMLNFITGAVFAGIFGKFIERGSETGWNFENVHSNAFVYSNIYLTVVILIVSIVLAYYWLIDRVKVQYARR